MAISVLSNITGNSFQFCWSDQEISAVVEELSLRELRSSKIAGTQDSVAICWSVESDANIDNSFWVIIPTLKK